MENNNKSAEKKGKDLIGKFNQGVKGDGNAAASMKEENKLSSTKSTPSVGTQINQSGIPLYGVSLRWFMNFIETDVDVLNILKMKGEEAIMDDLLEVVVKNTSEVDESFAEMLMRTHPKEKLVKKIAD